MKRSLSETLESRPGAGLMAMAFAFFCFEFAQRSSVLLGVTALYQRDLFLLYFPLVQSALRVLSQGAWPLLDPSSAFGQPLLGDPSCQMLYPPVAIQLLLPPHQAYAWFVSLHSVFGAMAVALLARRFSGGSWLAAFASGCAWLASGPLQSMATLWHHQAGAAWMPWILLGVDRVVESPTSRRFVALGVAFGAQILAGSADMCAMTLLVAVLFVPPRSHRFLLKGWLASGAIGLCLSAGMWLPAAELVSHSARAALPEAMRTYWSLHPLSALELFLPVPVNALPLQQVWRDALFEGRDPFLGSMFLGALILPLVLAALADSQVPRRVRAGAILAATSAFLIALGKHAVFYSIAVTVLPPLKILRFPTKAMVPFALLMCVLAGVGAASIRRSARARALALAGAILGIAVTAFWLVPAGPVAAMLLDTNGANAVNAFLEHAGSRLWFSLFLLALLVTWTRLPSGRIGASLATLLLAGHLLQSHDRHAGFNATVPADLLAYRPDTLATMKPPEGSRVYVYDYTMVHGRALKYLGSENVSGGVGLTGARPDAANMIASYAYLTPLTGAFWGVDYAWDADLRQLFDRRLAALTLGLRQVEGTPAFLKMLRMSGVSRVGTRHDAGLEDFRLLARTNVYYPSEMRIFEVPDPAPRAYLVSGRRRSTGSDLTDLTDPSFDPATMTLVDDGAARDPQSGFVGQARILHRIADRLTIQTDANGPAFLTLLEGSMPGWRVWVDGQAATLERANGIFIGTEVPSGPHRVEFRYLPRTVVVGLTSTVLSALGLMIWLLRRRDPMRAELTSGL